MDEHMKNEELLGDTQSIDKLIEEGRKRVIARIISGHSDPVNTNADFYLERALELMQKEGSQNPQKEYEVHLLLAVYLAHSWKKSEAAPHFERCVELRPQDLGLRVDLAGVYRDLGRAAESARQYKEAAKLCPVLSIGKYSNLAHALIESQRR